MMNKASSSDAQNPEHATPATEPTARPGLLEKGEDEANDQENSSEGLANRELDEQTTLARPPMGN